MNPHLKRKIKAILAPIRRIGLVNRDFSILSNNCWGGFQYDKFHLPYRTPTVGLFIPPKDYIKFLKNLEYYFGKNLEQITFANSKHKDMILRKVEKGWLSDPESLIIGRLEDVEIFFLHYNTFQDAEKKWNNRKNRIDYDNLLVKFNDQNEFEIDDYYEFEKLNFKNKLFLTSNKELKNQKDVFFIKKYEKMGFAFDDMHNDFNIIECLNRLKDN